MKKAILIVLAIMIAGELGYLYYRTRTTEFQPGNKPSNTLPASEEQNSTATRPAGGNAENSTGTASSTLSEADKKIKTFEDCVAAGKPVDGQKPHRRCVVADNLAFIEIETCKAPTGESMDYYTAQRIFDASQCAIEGSADSDPYCNPNTGTWWIDILTFRKGCDPACVINVITKKAEVNWRCTGAQP
ncbi:MAG: hypothetical protein WA093_00775 [Minisyncoccales bacterium]